MTCIFQYLFNNGHVFMNIFVFYINDIYDYERTVYSWLFMIIKAIHAHFFFPIKILKAHTILKNFNDSAGLQYEGLSLGFE